MVARTRERGRLCLAFVGFEAASFTTLDFDRGRLVRVGSGAASTSPSTYSCDACQRHTGTAFHIGASYPKHRVRLDGERKLYERDADNGHRIRFHFCPTCGSTLFWEGGPRPFMIHKAA